MKVNLYQKKILLLSPNAQVVSVFNHISILDLITYLMFVAVGILIIGHVIKIRSH